MTDQFEESLTRDLHFGKQSVKISGLSPEKYGSVAYKNLSYTPELLQNNFIFKEITINKKVENQKNRIRQLESLNSLLEEKIKHLNDENQTIKGSLELQVQMYKKMLREQEDQAKIIIKNLQNQYTFEIKKILTDHEQDSKVSQAEKEELQKRIQELLQRINELQGNLYHKINTINEITGNLNLTSQKLINTEDKMIKAQDIARQSIQRLGKQLDALNNRLLLQNSNFKQKLDLFNTEKIRQIEALKRLHLTELDKLQNKRDAEINDKNLDIKDLKNTFDAEARRFQDIIAIKDRSIEALSNELKRQKDTMFALTRNYDLQINRLVDEKQHILHDLALISNQKNQVNRKLSEVILLYQSEKGRNAVVVNSLQGEIGKKNIRISQQNQKLLKTVNQYEKELAITNHKATTLQKTLDVQRSEQVHKLMLQIRNLKQILVQSSGQMQRCKQQFVRMQIQKQRLLTINSNCESQAIRLKSIINQLQFQLRARRI